MNRLTTAEKKKRKTLEKSRAKEQWATGGPLTELPPAPAFLRAEGKKAYQAAGSDLLDRKALKTADITLLEQYATAVQTAADAQRLLSAEGLIYEDKNGQARRHPAFTVWRSAVDTARNLAARLTVTPYDRARAPEVVQEEEEFDPVAEIMARWSPKTNE